jgi:hypothetical protein
MNQLDEQVDRKKPYNKENGAKGGRNVYSGVNSPKKMRESMEEEDLNRQEISKQLEEIEKNHIGLKDL